MPIPKRKPNEDQQKYVARCMGNETLKKEFPDNKQRIAICLGQVKKNKGSILSDVCDILEYDINYQEILSAYELTLELEEDGEVVTADNIIFPDEQNYVDFNEETSEFDISDIAKYTFRDPKTNELYNYDRMGVYQKDGRNLVYVSKSAEYQGRKVTLNKPFRTPSGPKKFAVYTTNESGNVVIVRFGDPNMKIKKNIPERRRSFRARHHCENPGPKWKARYWSCRAW